MSSVMKYERRYVYRSFHQNEIVDVRYLENSQPTVVFVYIAKRLPRPVMAFLDVRGYWPFVFKSGAEHYDMFPTVKMKRVCRTPKNVTVREYIYSNIFSIEL